MQMRWCALSPNAQLSSGKPPRRIARSEIGLHLLPTRFGASLSLFPVQLLNLETKSRS